MRNGRGLWGSPSRILEDFPVVSQNWELQHKPPQMLSSLLLWDPQKGNHNFRKSPNIQLPLNDMCTAPFSPLSWVAVRDLKLSYCSRESLFTYYKYP